MRLVTYNKLKNGIQQGIYKSIRLIQVKDDGSKDFLTKFSSVKQKDSALERLKYIKYLLDEKLPPGNYKIEAQTGVGSNNSFNEYFDVPIKTRVTIPIIHNENGNSSQSIEDKTNDTETMRETDLEELKELYKTNAELEATVKVLELRIKLLEAEKQNAPLADPVKTSTAETIMKGLSDHAGPLLGIFDEYFKLANRKLDLAEKNGKVKKVAPGKKTYEQILAELQSLEESDPDKFNKLMDQYKASSPTVYQRLLKDLEYEEDDDQEDEEDTEQESDQQQQA